MCTFYLMICKVNYTYNIMGGFGSLFLRKLLPYLSRKKMGEQILPLALKIQSQECLHLEIARTFLKDHKEKNLGVIEHFCLCVCFWKVRFAVSAFHCVWQFFTEYFYSNCHLQRRTLQLRKMKLSLRATQKLQKLKQENAETKMKNVCWYTNKSTKWKVILHFLKTVTLKKPHRTSIDLPPKRLT